MTARDRVRLAGGMELTEAFRRIVVRHLALILAMVLLGATGAYFLHRHDVPLYSASARLVIDTADPKAGTESTAIADTVRAIATSPSHVDAALKALRLRRDATYLSQKRIAVDALGTSGVISLTVTDADPTAAASLANFLAADVVTTRQSLDITSEQKQIDALTGQIAGVNAALAALDGESPGPLSFDPQLAAAQLSSFEGAQASERASLTSERVALEQQRAQLVAAIAGRPSASVIDEAQPPTVADAPRTPIDLAIAILAGLVVGVALAALIDALTPRVVGDSAVARAFGVPVVGRIPAAPAGPADPHRLFADLRMVGVQAGVKHVRLLPVGRVEPAPLLEALDLVARQNALQPVATGFDSALWLADPGKLNGQLTKSGLVLVAASDVSERDLLRAADTVEMSGWRVLGVISAEARSRPWLPVLAPMTALAGRNAAPAASAGGTATSAASAGGNRTSAASAGGSGTAANRDKKGEEAKR